MINLQSKTKFDSKIFPGVVVFIRKYTDGVKRELRRQLAVDLRAANEAHVELDRLREEYKAAIQADPEASASEELLQAIQAVDTIHHDRIRPAYIRAAFVSAAGIDIDGRALTANDVVDDCPPEFTDEVYNSIASEYGLTERQKGESAPPSISGAPEGGSDPNISAESAGGKDFTGSATVIDTSLS